MRCKLTKYGLFSVTLMLLIVFGCRQDDFYVSTDQQPQLKQRSQDINIRSISFQDFKMKLNDMRNRPNVEEFISESGHGSDWIIYTDEIKEITRGDYTSYTLYLQTSDTKEHNFYNLTIEEKGENTYVFVTKYSASGEWDKNVETFQGEIIAYRIPFDPSTGGIKLTVCCGDMNDGGGGGSSAPPQSSPEYPYDCEGYVVTTIIELPYQCSCDGHWPWQSCECWGNLPGYVSINQYTCVPYSDLPDPSEGNPGNPGGGGSGTGGSPNPPADLTFEDDSITTPVKNPQFTPVDDDAQFITFYNGLSSEQQSIIDANMVQFFGYLVDNDFSEEAQEFTGEIIDLAILEENQSDINNLVGMTLLIEGSGSNFFTEETGQSMLQFMDMNDQYPPFNPFSFLPVEYTLKYIQLKDLNPEWSNAKCMWYATKEFIHLALDVFGLVPLVGEPADIINGVLYTIEGDTFNASLSYASALPVIGYGASTTKFGIRFTTTVNDISSRVKLVWKVTATGIDFGSSSKLRKVLGITSSSVQAHHIIPWAFRNNDAVQKAAKSGSAFHMNEALNGIPIHTDFHFGSHPNYNNQIQQYLNAIPSNATPDQAYNAINTLINNIRTAIQNNPTTHINQLTF